MSNTTKLQITNAVLDTMYQYVAFGKEQRQNLAQKIVDRGSHALKWADGAAGAIAMAERVERDLASLEDLLKSKQTTAAKDNNAVLQAFCYLYEGTREYLLTQHISSSTSRMSNLVDMETRDAAMNFLRIHKAMYKDAKWHLTGEEK